MEKDDMGKGEKRHADKKPTAKRERSVDSELESSSKRMKGNVIAGAAVPQGIQAPPPAALPLQAPVQVPVQAFQAPPAAVPLVQVPAQAPAAAVLPVQGIQAPPPAALPVQAPVQVPVQVPVQAFQAPPAAVPLVQVPVQAPAAAALPVQVPVQHDHDDYDEYADEPLPEYYVDPNDSFGTDSSNDYNFDHNRSDEDSASGHDSPTYNNDSD